MRKPQYLLDTTILLLLLRAGDLGKRIDATYGLRQQTYRPLVSIVSHGEIWSMAEYRCYGDKKRKRLQNMLDNLVTVDISSNDVIRAYVEIDCFSRRLKSAVNMGKNDLWIAATAKATDSILLTTDQKMIKHLPLDLVKYEFIEQTRS